MKFCHSLQLVRDPLSDQRVVAFALAILGPWTRQLAKDPLTNPSRQQTAPTPGSQGGLAPPVSTVERGVRVVYILANKALDSKK